MNLQKFYVFCRHCKRSFYGMFDDYSEFLAALTRAGWSQDDSGAWCCSEHKKGTK